MPTDGFPKDEVVECRDAIQILSRDLEKLCNLEERVIRDPATSSLDDQQGIDGSPPFVRVMRSQRLQALVVQRLTSIWLRICRALSYQVWLVR